VPEDRQQQNNQSQTIFGRWHNTRTTLKYTVVHKKTGHYIISDNFVKCEPIFFRIFALLERRLYFQQKPSNIFPTSPQHWSHTTLGNLNN